MKIKNQNEILLTPSRMAIIKNVEDNIVGKDMEKLWTSYTLLVEVENGAATVENSLAVFQNDNTESTCVCVLSVQSCLIFCNSMNCSPPGSSVHGIFPRKNTRAGWHFLLQEIFPTQVSNPSLLHLLHWQADSLLLAPPGKPHRIKTWLSNSVPRFMHSKPFQLCSTLGNPLGHSPPGSSVYGILQARYWSGFPRPPPDNPPNSRIEPVSLASSTPRLLKTGIQGSTCTWVSITTLFTIAKGEENSHVHKWRNGNKIQQICTIE